MSYATSGGYAGVTETRPTFTTPADGTQQNEVYQSEGGKVTATASTTAIDGSTVQASVTFYIEGPTGGVTNANITSQLDQLYPGSPSYPSGGTNGLMTQVATLESSYQHFRYPGQGGPSNPEPDLFNLAANFGIDAKWPTESKGGGQYIGLMQLGPAATSAEAWNWLTNTSDAVNLFSGNPVSQNKISVATTYENQIISEYTPKLSPLVGVQVENMALVFYGGFGKSDLTKQYYIPVCSPPGKVVKTYTCKGGNWQWAPNSAGNVGGVDYVTSVRAQVPPQ